MAKPRRTVYADVPHHITARANKGAYIFNSDKDRETYSLFVQENARKQGVKIYAWCLMSNHVHFIMEPPEENSLAKLFKVVQQRYSRYINKKEHTFGINWQGRYYATPVDLKHLYEAIRYVELNPIKAGITTDLGTYPWTSARGRFTGEHHIMVDPICKYSEIDDWASYLEEEVDDEVFQALYVTAPSACHPVIRYSYRCANGLSKCS